MSTQQYVCKVSLGLFHRFRFSSWFSQCSRQIGPGTQLSRAKFAWNLSIGKLVANEEEVFLNF